MGTGFWAARSVTPWPEAQACASAIDGADQICAVNSIAGHDGAQNGIVEQLGQRGLGMVHEARTAR